MANMKALTEIQMLLSFTQILTKLHCRYHVTLFIAADGPYGLQVNSDKGLKVGEVFTVDLGEAILFDCSADSYPPNTYSWIGMTDNTTYFIKHGPRLEVAPEKVAQMTADYACCAYNNVTGRQDETHFTVIITSMGKCDRKGNIPKEDAAACGLSFPHLTPRRKRMSLWNFSPSQVSNVIVSMTQTNKTQNSLRRSLSGCKRL